MSDLTERTRTVSWHDPLIGAGAAKTISGLEYLRAMGRGELPPPPVMALINMGFELVESGRVVFTLEPAEYHYNPIGSVHGGVITTVCDSAMGCAVHTLLSAGVGYTTLEIKVMLCTDERPTASWATHTYPHAEACLFVTFMPKGSVRASFRRSVLHHRKEHDLIYFTPRRRD